MFPFPPLFPLVRVPLFGTPPPLLLASVPFGNTDWFVRSLLLFRDGGGPPGIFAPLLLLILLASIVQKHEGSKEGLSGKERDEIFDLIKEEK